MASPADAVAYAAQAGWDQATVMYVVQYLRTGIVPDGVDPRVLEAIQTIGGMGLSSDGVNQLDYYLTNGEPPPELSYQDQSAEVLGTAPQAAPAETTAAAPLPPSPEQESARAILRRTLDEYGLGALADRLYQRYLDGAPMEQIMLEMRQTDEYKTRFAGMEALQAKGRAISEAEYIAVERSYAQVMHAAGLPVGFYDSPDDFSRLIGGEVSAAELADRVQTYTRVALQSPPEVQAELQRLYGIGPGELTAYFIDPDRALPLLQNQAAAAEAGGAALRSGFGSLDVGQAEMVARSGVNAQQAEAGFGALVDARELFTSLDSGEQAIGEGTQLGAVFGGNARAREEIEKRRRRRQAAFEGGGGYARSETGFSGIGSAS